MPWKSYLSGVFKNGEVPLHFWSGDFSFYDNPFFSVWYPFNFLFFDLYTDPIHAMRSEHCLKLLHFGFLYVLSFGLSQRFVDDKGIGLLVASSITFSTAYAVLANWVATFYPLVWLIGSASCLLAYLDHEGNELPRWPGLGLILSGVLMILSGPALGITFFFYVGGVIYLCFIAGRAWSLRELSVKTIGLVGAGLCIALLTSHAILPTYLSMGELIRWYSVDGVNHTIQGAGKLPLAALNEGAYQLQDVPNLLFPFDREGRQLLTMGPFLLLFSCLAIYRDKRDWKVWGAGVLTTWFLLSTFSDAIGIDKINYQLPGLNTIRHPWCFSLIFVVFSSVLAGRGLWLFIEGGSRRSRWLVVLLYALMTLVVVSVLVSQAELDLARRAGALFALQLIALLLLGNFSASRLRLVKAICLFVLCMSVSIFQRTHERNAPLPTSAGSHLSAGNLAAHEVHRYIAANYDTSQFRVISDIRSPGLQARLFDAVGLYYGVRTFRLYGSPLRAKQFYAYNHKFEPSAYYPTLGARFLVTNRDEYETNESLVPVEEFGEYVLYEYKEYNPTFYLAKRGFFVDSLESELRENGKAFRSGDLYLTGGQRLPSPLSADTVAGWGNASGELSVLVNENVRFNHISISANTSREAILVINYFFTQDWVATVNGSRVETVPVNGRQIGIPLEAGQSRVVLDYRPKLYFFLLGLSAATALLMAGVTIAIVFKRYLEPRCP